MMARPAVAHEAAGAMLVARAPVPVILAHEPARAAAAPQPAPPVPLPIGGGADDARFAGMQQQAPAVRAPAVAAAFLPPLIVDAAGIPRAPRPEKTRKRTLVDAFTESELANSNAKVRVAELQLAAKQVELEIQRLATPPAPPAPRAPLAAIQYAAPPAPPAPLAVIPPPAQQAAQQLQPDEPTADELRQAMALLRGRVLFQQDHLDDLQGKFAEMVDYFRDNNILITFHQASNQEPPRRPVSLDAEPEASSAPPEPHGPPIVISVADSQ